MDLRDQNAGLEKLAQPTVFKVQVFGNCCKLFQGGFEIGGDVGGDDFGCREVGAFFQRIILKPEDVEVRLVALGQCFIGEGLEALALFAVVTILVL